MAAAPPLPSAPQPPRVLVVDDYAPNIVLVGELLRGHCELFMATNGEQALAQVLALRPDLVLLDVVMPGMDGHEVCRRLKADARTAAVPVVFLTGQQDEADQAAGLALGAADYLTKPVDAARLRACVREQLARQWPALP